jgi:hypothetical protein
MGHQGPGRVWGSVPLGEPGGASGKKKFLTLSVYDFKLKKKQQTKQHHCLYIDFLWNFFF